MDWDEGVEVGGPHEPYRQSQRMDLYRDVARRLLEGGYAYESFSTPEEIEARHRAAGRDPKLGYDDFDRDLTDEQNGRATWPRAASPCCGCGCPTRTSRSPTWCAARRHLQGRFRARLRDRARQRRSRCTRWSTRSTTRSWGSPTCCAARTCCPRRRARSCCTARCSSIGVADRAARVRAPAVRHGRGQQEAVQARPGVEPVPAPRARLHPRGPAELPRAAGLVHRRRTATSSPSRRWSPPSTSPTSTRTRPGST